MKTETTTAAAARCSACDKRPPHPKSRKGYCAVCLGAARERRQAMIRAARIEAAGRREEAAYILESAEAAAAATPADPVSVRVVVTPATTSFAAHARLAGWAKHSNWPGVATVVDGLARGLAFRATLLEHGLEAAVVVS